MRDIIKETLGITTPVINWEMLKADLASIFAKVNNDERLDDMNKLEHDKEKEKRKIMSELISDYLEDWEVGGFVLQETDILKDVIHLLDLFLQAIKPEVIMIDINAKPEGVDIAEVRRYLTLKGYGEDIATYDRSSRLVFINKRAWASKVKEAHTTEFIKFNDYEIKGSPWKLRRYVHDICFEEKLIAEHTKDKECYAINIPHNDYIDRMEYIIKKLAKIQDVINNEYSDQYVLVSV